MDSLQKIGKFEATSIMVMVTITQIVLNLPSCIIINTGSSSWLNVLYVSIIAILFCLFICKLFKPFSSSDIVDISEFLGGKILKAIVGILYILFFIFLSSIVIRYFASSLKLIYFENSPLVFLLLLFLIPVLMVAKIGIKAISKVNLIITIILSFSLLIILFSTAKNFVFEQIYPIMGYGVDKTFLVGICNIFAFSSFAYLFFLIPILDNPNEFKKIAISSTIISAIYLFLSVICLIMVFPFISFTDEMLSVYLLTRIIEFGKFFQRVDAIFIFVWILSTLSFLAFTTHLITYIFKKITKIKDNKEMIYILINLIFVLSLLYNNIAILKFLQNVVFKYWTIILVFILSLIILILANLKLKRRHFDAN